MAKGSRSKKELRPNRGILGRTLILLAVCGIVLFTVLLIRLYKVMIVEHDRYEELAVEQQTRQTVIHARRGSIYDAKGNALAVSATAYNVFISPYEINKYDENIDLIAETLPVLLADYGCKDADSIRSMAKDTSSWYKTVAYRVDAEAVDGVRRFISDNSLSGVHIEETSKRYYPYSTLACHVVGFVGAENYGLEGIEAYYDEFLAGTDGSVARLKSGSGDDMLIGNYEEYTDSRNGSDVTLTVDMGVQYIVEKHLEQAVADYDCAGGCCIVMDVNTGAIRAMASLSNYDLNDYQAIDPDILAQIQLIEDPDERAAALRNAQYAQWRNMAISDTYEPGSVFKIITLAMALEDNCATLSSSYSCGGSMNVQGRGIPLKCWRTAGHGHQSLQQAVQHSCNVAFVQIGMSVGAERFYHHARAFGLFDKTGIDIGGEAVGSWWTDAVFTDPDNKSQLAAASFGQTFTITPLQMAAAVGAAVNGGYLMQPHLVESIVDADGQVVYTAPRSSVRQVISADTSRTVCAILESVVSGEGGTGKNAYVPGYRIGGKTGTSEKVAHQAETGSKDYMVSFCGVAPIDDPELVVLFILDSPSQTSGYYVSGGNMAAPAVSSILSELLPYLGYEPKYTEDESEYVDAAVPYVTGAPVAQAQSELEALGLKVTVVGEGGVVTDQLPAANSEVAAGSNIILYAGESAPQERVEVPDVNAMTVAEARETLERCGLYLDTTGASPINENAVVSVQFTAAGTMVRYGSTVRVTLIDASILGHY